MARILQLPKSQKFRAEGIPAEGIPHESAGEAFGTSPIRGGMYGVIPLTARLPAIP